MTLLETLQNTIREQEKNQNDEYNSIMELRLQERVNKGYAISNVSVYISFYESTPNNWCPPLIPTLKYIDTVKIQNNNNNSRFREGTQIILSHGNDYKFKLDVVKDGVKEFILQSNQFEVGKNYIDFLNYPRNNWEINIENQTTTTKLLNATYTVLTYSPDYCNHLENLFNGNFINQYSEIDETVLSKIQSNDSQREAIRKALSTSYFHLIQGPPGTGKTYTIAKLVNILVASGKKVFVTGPTHTSINNCLNAVSADLHNKSKIVKVGEKYQADEIADNQNVSFVKNFKYSSYLNNDAFSKEGIVVGATPFALCYPASKKLEGWDFDYVIVDEAAQMNIPLALSAIMRGRKIVFVGDHKQLDPIVQISQGKNKSELFSDSIFRKFTDLYPNDVTLLKESYRLNEELIRIPNELSYEGKLISRHPTEKEYENFHCDFEPEIINHPSNELLVLHHTFDSLGRSPFEAKLVANIVADLIANNVKVEDIGIISPYRAQIREIRNALVEQNVVDVEDIDNVFVDTVERMQGQEKAYILFSMSNSNPEETCDRLEFFYSPNRLNVAITRAYTKLIVIANEKVFDFCQQIVSKDDMNKQNAEIFLRYKHLATKIYLSEEQILEEW